jgi:hypothetical protein
MNVERGSPNQRSQDLAEADQFADSTTHLEPDPEQSNESQSDEGPSP